MLNLRRSLLYKITQYAPIIAAVEIVENANSGLEAEFGGFSLGTRLLERSLIFATYDE